MQAVDLWKCIYCDGPILRRPWEQDRAEPGTRFCAVCQDSMRGSFHREEVRQQRLKEHVRRKMHGDPHPVWEDDEPLLL